MPESRETYGIIGSTGEIELYHDPYAGISIEDVQLADYVENIIITEQQNIETSFLKIGTALIQFEDLELWRAKGMPSFRAWLSGPEFMFSYEHGTRLMRVVRDLIPIIGEQEHVPPVSKLIAMLPLVADGRTDDEIREVFDDIQALPVRAAKDHIREVRGIDRPEQPTTFRARVQNGETYNNITVTRYGEDGDIYELGRLQIKPKDWPRWSARFGEGFIEYV